MRFQVIFLLIIYIYFICFSSINSHSLRKTNANKYRGKISNVAKKFLGFIETFTTKKHEIHLQPEESRLQRCESPNQIEEYFFQVYGTQDMMSQQNVDDLIEFSVNKVRDGETKNKHTQFKCPREKVKTLKKNSEFT